jgi:hypothetical protein
MNSPVSGSIAVRAHHQEGQRHALQYTWLPGGCTGVGFTEHRVSATRDEAPGSPQEEITVYTGLPKVICEGGNCFLRITQSDGDRDAISDSHAGRGRSTVSFGSGASANVRQRHPAGAFSGL